MIDPESKPSRRGKHWPLWIWALLAGLSLAAVVLPLLAWMGMLALACATGGGCL